MTEDIDTETWSDAYRIFTKNHLGKKIFIKKIELNEKSRIR